VRVRACDSGWATVTSVTNVVELSSTDESANLPAPAALAAGEGVFTITLNANGNFTISADDQTDATIPLAVSAPVNATALHGFEFSRINQKNQYAGAMDQRARGQIPGTPAAFSGPVNLREITTSGKPHLPASSISPRQWSGRSRCTGRTRINRGNVNIYAVLESDPSRNGTSDPFSVHPGPMARVQIVLPGQSPLPGSVAGLTGSPASQAAGQAFTVSVNATDAYWNLLLRGWSDHLQRPRAQYPVTGAEQWHPHVSVSLATVGTQT
jgi:hypothetical protein